MSDLISRQAAIDYLMDNMTWYSEDGYETDDEEKRECITSLINAIPSVSTEKTGRWIKEEMECYTEYVWKCSNCEAHHRALFDYCPTCGAKMQEE